MVLRSDSASCSSSSSIDTARVIRLPNVRSDSPGASRVPYTNLVAKAARRPLTGRYPITASAAATMEKPRSLRSALSPGASPRPSTITR